MLKPKPFRPWHLTRLSEATYPMLSMRLSLNRVRLIFLVGVELLPSLWMFLPPREAIETMLNRNWAFSGIRSHIFNFFFRSRKFSWFVEKVFRFRFRFFVLRGVTEIFFVSRKKSRSHGNRDLFSDRFLVRASVSYRWLSCSGATSW